MVPETLLGPQEFAFSANEESIVAGLKIDEEGRRTLRGHIELPKFGEPTSTHIIYEIMRSMPRPELRSPAQQALYVRLNGMMLAVHNYAMSQYTARTGLDFKSDFNL